jgi:hypothetical protein
MGAISEILEEEFLAFQALGGQSTDSKLHWQLIEHLCASCPSTKTNISVYLVLKVSSYYFEVMSLLLTGPDRAISVLSHFFEKFHFTSF